ncbi:MAG TPA: cyanophycinase [Longimicrobiaceae bacterium]|jgi:cyanophycinase
MARSRNGNSAPENAPEPDEEHPNRRRTDRQAGTLVLIGGACEPQGDALGSFLDRCNARQGGKVVGITTASTDPAGSAREWMGAFAAAGAHNVEIPVIDRRDRAQDARIAEMIRGADGIFFGGGDQVHLVATLGGSRVDRAVREAYSRGAVVCGTSAGAAALTETILAGGEPDEYGQMQDLHLGPGFGLLGFRAMIDTHFSQRRRLQRLFMVIAQNPELMGLGIDEDTAVVIHGHLGEVRGRGSVTFVDGRGVRFDNADECMNGAPLTLSYLRVGIVGAGYTFNLRERELEVLVQARESREEMEVVRGEDAEVPGEAGTGPPRVRSA